MKKILVTLLFMLTTPFLHAWNLPEAATTANEYAEERAQLNALKEQFELEKEAFKDRQAQIQAETQLPQAIALIGLARDTAHKNKDKSEAYRALKAAIDEFDQSFDAIMPSRDFAQLNALVPLFMLRLYGLLSSCGEDEKELIASIRILGNLYIEAQNLSKKGVMLTLKKYAIALRLARLDILENQENVAETNKVVLENLELWMMLKTEAKTSPSLPDDVKTATLDLATRYVLPKSNDFAAYRDAETLRELAHKNEIVVGQNRT